MLNYITWFDLGFMLISHLPSPEQLGAAPDQILDESFQMTLLAQGLPTPERDLSGVCGEVSAVLLGNYFRCWRCRQQKPLSTLVAVNSNLLRQLPSNSPGFSLKTETTMLNGRSPDENSIFFVFKFLQSNLIKSKLELNDK